AAVARAAMFRPRGPVHVAGLAVPPTVELPLSASQISFLPFSQVSRHRRYLYRTRKRSNIVHRTGGWR
ncbi:hypothetical protein NGA_2062000, partial [Nannochloropsis gaditana CCMP526]|uniref:uncharacterized protein n=1 Tax=Nannochloropsis gaditana (strain CCMP526) TaxID=1093141 RepID=UPI00029F7B5A